MEITFCHRSRCWDSIHLEWVCPDALAQMDRGRTFGTTVTIEAGIELSLNKIAGLLDDALTEGHASDHWGNTAHLPASTPFQVHSIRQRDGGIWYSAIYSGQTPPLELLATGAAV